MYREYCKISDQAGLSIFENNDKEENTLELTHYFYGNKNSLSIFQGHGAQAAQTHDILTPSPYDFEYYKESLDVIKKQEFSEAIKNKYSICE